MQPNVTPIEVFDKPPADFKFELEAAGCFCEWDGQFLILKRAVDKDQGATWGIPAGKLDPGESPLQAMIRETYEESNITVEANKARSLGKLYARHPKADFIFHIYAVQLDQAPDVRLAPKEHTDFCWTNAVDAGELDLMPGAPEVIEIYSKRQLNLQKWDYQT